MMKRLASLLAVVACGGLVTVLACDGEVAWDDPNGVGGSGVAGAGGSGAAGGGAAGGCATPLDEDILDELSLVFFPGIVELQPGQSHAFEVGVVECCYSFEPVETCVEWSVDPPSGATITEEGVLTIDSSVPNGAMFLVEAEVEQGRAVVTAEVWVYTEEENPLVGTYYEVAQLDCQTGEEFVPEKIIGELRYLANGRFMLTWVPFEVYVDYWGPYDYDLETGTLIMAADSGNYVPPDVEGDGSFSFDAGGDLLLEDMFLGSPYGGDPGTPGCGHRFQ